MKILLSAGHDNIYSGAVNKRYGLKEHYCALDICDMVMDRFHKNPSVIFLDATHNIPTYASDLIRMGWKEDFVRQLKKNRPEHLSLWWKVATVNKKNREAPISLAVELHFNACESHRAHGAEVLYLSEKSKGYAVQFQPLLEDFDGKYDGRQIKHSATLIWLHYTKMPAVILEPLFIDNKRDCKPLLTHSGREDLTDAITEGIRRILREDYHAHVEESGARVLSPGI